MKTLTFSLFAFTFSFLAQAVPSYWAAAYVEAVPSDKSGGTETGFYSGYYCTKAAAQDIFGTDAGASAASLRDYFVSGYDAAMAALNVNVTAYPSGVNASLSKFTDVDYNAAAERYELKSIYGDMLPASEYLALLFYENGTTRYVMAMENDAAFLTDNHDALFEQAAGGAGWSSVAVPEPTSGLLMLVGLAGLALRRKRA